MLQKMKKIFIVEDDSGISESLKLYLENSDFRVHIYETGIGASQKILEESPDLVILDINLPGKDGIIVCKELREQSNIPVIMLTAKTQEWDKLEGFNAWADDYIAKPFSPRELLARIQSILRRFIAEDEEESEEWKLSFENIVIDTEKNIVLVNWNPISLTKNEFDILKKIFEQDGKLVERETLMKEVIWYNEYVYDRTIDTHIKNLRKKIENKDAILTIRWKWYRLNK